MKKILISVVVSFISILGFSQTNQWSLGLDLGYGTKIENAFLGAKLQYGINDDFDVAGSFNHYFKKYDVKYWEINADVHWNFLKSEPYKVYPLVGLTYLHSKLESIKDGNWGANIGVGAQYDFCDRFAMNLELKAQIMSETQFVPMLSFMYKL